MNSKVDNYLSNLSKWQDEIKALRQIVLECGLTEGYKWMHPCYIINNANVVLIHEFKEYCAILFFKGALLQDTEKILIQQTENVQAARQIRFTNTKQIFTLKDTIKHYIFEAIELEKAGLKVPLKKKEPLEIVAELSNVLKKNATLKKAFNALTPGRQNAYNFFFASAKQSKTREERIKKYSPRILNGFGLTDCVCGLSKRLPNCDGSHKHLNTPLKF